MSKIRLIQSLVRNGLYYLTEHANEEAMAEDFDVYDIECALITGKIRRAWPNEGKYEVIGSTLDGRAVGIICRITPMTKVRVITVYEHHAIK